MIELRDIVSMLCSTFMTAVSNTILESFPFQLSETSRLFVNRCCQYEGEIGVSISMLVRGAGSPGWIMYLAERQDIHK